MSTGYGWEGLGLVCATLLGVRHVSERLCDGSVYLGALNVHLQAYLFCIMYRRKNVDNVENNVKRVFIKKINNVNGFYTTMV